MRVLTYNVWFESHAFADRFEAVSEILRLSDADFICLQEVLPEFARGLRSLPWVKRQYSMSDPTGISCAPYGVLMLVRKDLKPRFKLHPLPTEMDRKLLTAACRVDGRDLTVATVHLESLDCPETREQQLEIIARIIRGDAILAGDFNFCSYRNYDSGLPLENDRLVRVLPGFVDVWTALRGSEPGYTYDSEVNKMIRMPRPDPQMRYDRVLACGVRATRIELVGDKPIDRAGTLFPSDHFGLCAEFAPA